VAYTVAVILLLAWLVGLLNAVGGALIHVLLLAGLAIVAVNLYHARRRG